MCRSWSKGMSREPEVGQVWWRVGMKERVRIGRVWHGDFTGVEDDYVRCHPIRGGAPWVTTVEEFLKRFDLDNTDA